MLARTIAAFLIAPLAAPLLVFAYSLMGVLTEVAERSEMISTFRVSQAFGIYTLIAITATPISYLLTACALVFHAALVWKGLRHITIYLLLAVAIAAIFGAAWDHYTLGKMGYEPTEWNMFFLYLPALLVSSVFYRITYRSWWK